MATRFDTVEKDRLWSAGSNYQNDAEGAERAYGTAVEQYGMDHYVKLEAIYHDAKNNRSSASNYYTAIKDFSAIVPREGKPVLPGMVPKAPVSKLAFLNPTTYKRLETLIANANVSLPNGADITDGFGVLELRKPVYKDPGSKEARAKERQDHKNTQKTFRNLLAAVTALLNYVAGLCRAGMAANAGREAKMELAALQASGILVVLQGYAQGVCHAQINHGLVTRLRQVSQAS